MAGAIIIASAIGVLLLILAGYVLVSGTLISADSIASAQKDMAQEKDEQVNTAIQVSAQAVGWTNPWHYLTFTVKNIGNAPINDFNRTDMFITVIGSTWSYDMVRYSFNGSGAPGNNFTRTWGYLTIIPDKTHPSTLDPGETMTAEIDTIDFPGGPNPYYIVNISTPNGITNGSVSP